MSLTAPTGPARPPSTASPAGAARGTSSLRPPGQRVLLRWLLEVTRPVLRPLLRSVVCRVVSLLAGAALLALGAYAVADAAVHLSRTGAPGALRSAWAIVSAMAVLALLKAALRYAEQFLGHLVAFRALELLRAELFRALLPRAPRLSAGSRSGDLLARATKDIDRIEVFFAHTLAPAVSALVVPAAVLVVVSATTSWVVALAVLPLLAAQLVLVPALGARASVRASRAASRQRAALTHHVKDTVQAMGDIVGYGRERQRLEQLAALDANVASALRPSTTWASLRRGASQVLGLAAPVVVVAAGAGNVDSGSVSVPALAAAAAAVLRLSGTAQGAEALVSALAPALASAERVWEVVHAPVERHDGTRELSSGISHEVLWQGVSYTYPAACAALDSTSGSGSLGGSVLPGRAAPTADAGRMSRAAPAAAPALNDVSLRARAGRWTCVVGASGSGKSTLAMLVLRCEPLGPGSAQTGRVLIDGIDVRDLRTDSLYQEVALVPQHAHLFRACVADNVRLAAPSASDEEVREACRAAGVHEEVEALPHGYDTLVGERGETLSGGQRQRLALARALLARPNLLVLDELSSHLDPQTQARVRAGIRRYLPEATVVEITHQVRQSVQADHVVVLDAGKVVQEGSPSVLLEVDGPLRTLLARG
ncbi:ABC transporter ATP-binding protein [Actinomyces sp. 2119]|uniref:ABC transporter ATP-binding protein n=1 Tax=Actinomyces sp. 2119 TaxID=2321393 RepID=UPI002872B2E4|nr:ABC transporter ATP-binding protein [Actinomyces sp. 2119]